jgi:hypothetical protein
MPADGRWDLTLIDRKSSVWGASVDVRVGQGGRRPYKAKEENVVSS